MKECTVEDYLVMRVKALGGEVRKVKWIGRRGAPDRLCMFLDRPAVWVELKRPGGLATFPKDAHERAQHREHVRMRARKQAVIVLDSFESIDRWIEG